MAILKRPALTCAVLATCLALSLAACGSSKSSSQPAKQVGTTHAVVGFTAHAGLAFGAFKLFVYNPYKAGKLSLHHPLTLAKAAAGALFAYHEIKKAEAELAGHPKLEKLVKPVAGLAAGFSLLRAHLEKGDTSDISSVNSSIGSVSSQASTAGSPIQTVTSGIHL